jgi:hypothetical protein
MSDFSELENELKALRPARPSPVLFERIEGALAEDRKRSGLRHTKWNWQRFIPWSRGQASGTDEQLARAKERSGQTPFRLGIGLAAAVAAVLLLLARINTDHARNEGKEVAQISHSSETRPVLPAFSDPRDIGGSTSSNRFIPAGTTQVVYNERDEGLQFADGSSPPVRRLRYETRQTWQWRNPTTGASLRVSYPSEEVVLIPVSGQ